LPHGRSSGLTRSSQPGVSLGSPDDAFQFTLSNVETGCENSDMSQSMDVEFKRILRNEFELARDAFALLTRVFDEPQSDLDDAYLASLLENRQFWALAAVQGHSVIGGLTAWELPLTAKPAHELLIYDLAVDPAHWRRGYGRGLVTSLQQQAQERAIRVAWVPVDNDDAHALDFYKSIGGVATSTTIFTFGE
jgi:aminoglycoside 3-N-acetyltransferase I